MESEGILEPRPDPSRGYVPPTAGLRPSEVVAEYARAAGEAGNTRFLDRTSRAILGAQALRVIRHGEWDADIILRAVRTFAGTQRNPAFLEDWVRNQFAIDQENGSVARRKAEPRDGGLKSIFKAIKEAQS